MAIESNIPAVIVLLTTRNDPRLAKTGVKKVSNSGSSDEKGRGLQNVQKLTQFGQPREDVTHRVIKAPA